MNQPELETTMRRSKTDRVTGLVLEEVELSITARCTLSCSGCGFMVPHQPAPASGDVVESHRQSLRRLGDAGVTIESLAIMGGEVGLAPRVLERMVGAVRSVGIVKRIEVVTNGLSPQGISDEVLTSIDRLSISVYGYSERLLDGWRAHIAHHAPALELVLRTHEGGWDDWNEVAPVDRELAQRAFETCWYRRHCVTIERGRLFVCPRIPKLGRDAEGLELFAGISMAHVHAHLASTEAPQSCATCGPMLSKQTVVSGVQPDDRIRRLEVLATSWLERANAGAASDGSEIGVRS